MPRFPTVAIAEVRADAAVAEAESNPYLVDVTDMMKKLELKFGDSTQGKAIAAAAAAVRKAQAEMQLKYAFYDTYQELGVRGQRVGHSVVCVCECDTVLGGHTAAMSTSTSTSAHVMVVVNDHQHAK